MLNEVGLFLLDIFVQGYAGLLLFRFVLQWLRAPLRNPAGEFIMALTDCVVLPARRYIPAAYGLDSSSLLLAWGVEVLYLGLVFALQGLTFSAVGLVVFSAVKLFGMAVYLLMGALFMQAILSWINPHTPLAPLLHAITDRFLRPLQRVIPLIGNIDLSSLVLLVICQIVLMIPLRILENLALHLM